MFETVEMHVSCSLRVTFRSGWHRLRYNDPQSTTDEEGHNRKHCNVHCRWQERLREDVGEVCIQNNVDVHVWRVLHQRRIRCEEVGRTLDDKNTASAVA